MIDEDLLEELEEYRMRESIRNRMLDLENIGWAPLEGLSEEDDGPDLDSLKKISPKLRDMAATNPWHIRGAQLRHSYVFGRGVSFNNVSKPAVQKVINDPHNKSALFSVDAYETANLALFTDGNFFVIRQGERANARFIVVPIKQVAGVVTNPDDSSDVWFIKRAWSANGEAQEKWYPVSRHKKTRAGRLPKSIKGVPVDQKSVMYYRTSKRQAGWTWGVPDSMGALVYTECYTEYLRDNLVLVKALSRVAWRFTNPNLKTANAAAAQIRDADGKIGGTALLAGGSQLQGVGVPSAQVNMGNGQPVVAAVATSFGVPVIALLSSPGETGGSYGAATSLDEPTLKGMQAVQNSWAAFYEEILRDVGAPDAVMEFPAISTDPTHRQVASIVLATTTGLLHRDEGRDAVMDLLDVAKMHDSLPKADGFNNWKDSETGGDPNARQGNTGAVPGGIEGEGLVNHDADESMVR